MSNLDRIKKRNSGSSLIELLVALALSTILALTLTHLLVQQLRASTRAAAQAAAVQQQALLQALLNSITRQADSFRGAELLVVHPAGEIRAFDGASILVGSGNPELRLAVDSTAITVTEVDTERILRRSTASTDGDNSVFTGCREFAGAPLNATAVPKNFDALGVIGADTVALSATVISRERNCLRVRLAPARDPFVAPSGSPELVPFVHQILPIVTARTIYLSTAGELRVLLHRNGAITTNQPLGVRLYRLACELKSQPIGADRSAEALRCSAYRDSSGQDSPPWQLQSWRLLAKLPPSSALQTVRGAP